MPSNVDKVKKPEYSENKNIQPDLQAGKTNVSSLMNIFAVMLAEGSGDPQVKQNVLRSLAERRAQVEAEALNRQNFENEVENLKFRSQLDLAGQKDAEGPDGVPSKQAAAKQAGVQAEVADRTKESAIAATTAGNNLAVKEAEAQMDPDLIKARAEIPILDKKAKELEIEYNKIRLEDAKNPRLKELALQKAELDVQKAKWEAVAAKFSAAGKGGGFGGVQAGLNANQHMQQINNDYKGETYNMPQAVKLKVARARDLAEQAPMWLQNMRYVGKYSQSSIDPVTNMTRPDSGELAYADMINAVVPVMQKISLGEQVTPVEGRILASAMEDAWNEDPMFFDNCVDELARSAQMLDPDTFGAFEPVVPGAVAEADSSEADIPADEVPVEEAQRRNARAWAVHYLASFGITKEMMEKHKQSREQARIDQMNGEKQQKENSEVKKMFKQQGPSSDRTERPYGWEHYPQNKNRE